MVPVPVLKAVEEGDVTLRIVAPRVEVAPEGTQAERLDEGTPVAAVAEVLATTETIEIKETSVINAITETSVISAISGSPVNIAKPEAPEEGAETIVVLHASISRARAMVMAMERLDRAEAQAQSPVVVKEEPATEALPLAPRSLTPDVQQERRELRLRPSRRALVPRSKASLKSSLARRHPDFVYFPKTLASFLST